MSMKIRMISGATYTVARADVTDGRLEIDFKDKEAEEIQDIFTIPAELSNIELLTDEGEKYGELPGWTVYGGITVYGDTKTVILTKETDSMAERLTNAEAKALSASVLAESTATQVTDLQLAMCEIYEGMGV